MVKQIMKIDTDDDVENQRKISGLYTPKKPNEIISVFYINLFLSKG